MIHKLEKHIKPHENIRIVISQLVMELTREVLDEILMYANGLDKFKIESFLKVLSNAKSWKSIIPQEIAASGGFVDMDFYGKIIFEIKGTERELKDGLKKVQSEYINSYPEAKYIILTTSSLWWIYKIKKPSQYTIFKSESPSSKVQLDKVFIGSGERKAREHLKQILREIITEQGYKIPARPEVLAVVFKEITSYEDEILKILENHKNDQLILPFIESFKSNIEVLYNEPSEIISNKLLVKHTILQMIVLSCLSRALNKFEGIEPLKICRGLGLDLDVSLPYLNWWYIVHSNSASEFESKIIEKLSSEITKHVELIDWHTSGPEDVFRELYELFIEQNTRRAIGEYYTPLWLVEYAIERLKLNGVSMRDKLVFDPFCGSGTFLSVAFHKKVNEGEPPEKSIEELVGFDINPLAISIARAELIVSYSKYKSEIPRTLIFHTDTLATMFRGQNILEISNRFTPSDSKYQSKLVELEAIQTSLRESLSKMKYEINPTQESNGSSNLIDILNIEKALGEIFRDVVSLKKDLYQPRLRELFSKYLAENRFGEHGIGLIFNKLLSERKEDFLLWVGTLLDKYGDGVWAATIASIMAPLAIYFAKSDIILTNPPWLQLSKFKPKYAENIRTEAMNILRKTVKKGAAEIVAGSDLASMALFGSINNASESLALIMPRESTFNYSTAQRSGLILTYSVFRNFESKIDNIELIDMNYDAFIHGNYPALVIVKLKNGEKVDER